MFVIRIRGHFLQHETALNQAAPYNLYSTYFDIMMQQKHILGRINNSGRVRVMRMLSRISTDNQDDLVQKASKILEKLQFLPFRKMKFSSKLYYD